MKIIWKNITCWFFLLSFLHVDANVTLPKIIGDDMVLQRGKKDAIWGYALPGEKVSVSFHNKTKNTVADTAGHWQILLDIMDVSATPSEMVIKGKNTITLKNILVGEVWLCSGQSNMEYTMRKNSKVVKTDSLDKNSPVDELDRAHNSFIRIFLVTQKNLLDKNPNTSGWSVAKDSALRSFSAAGYFFAKELYEKLHVPIGVISAAIPGSAIEPWLSGTIIKDSDINKPLALDEAQPGKFYPKMIQPLSPFTIKGFLWYQGETNCFQNETIEYTYKMQALINGWRKLWSDDKLSFYYVQIAPYYYSKSAGKFPLTTETLPKFWEAQTLAMQIPYTGMAVINDLSKSPDDLHPEGKWEVGRRLAQWALAKDYGVKVVPSGPMFKKLRVNGNKIELEFDYVGKGLTSKDGKPLTFFSIAAEDGKFFDANATILGDKIIVSSPLVEHPFKVRFAWSESAQPNFFNKDGLPALPFDANNIVWMLENKVL